MTMKRLWSDTRGSVLVEFTVTMLLFLLLTFGALQAGLLLYTQAGLQHGVEAAARCASVNYSAYQLQLNQSCFTGSGGTPTPSTVVSSPSTYIPQYAAQNSWGLNPALSATNFTVTSPASGGTCGTSTPGYVVNASYQYSVMRYLFSGLTLNAKSCFPINAS